MTTKELIYDVRERLSAISDDRHIDERYIQHLIDTHRANFLRKLLSQKPGYNIQNLEQNFHVDVKSTSRSIHPDIDLSCNILRSTVPVPNLIGNYYRLRTADILVNTIEKISAERASYLTFEFDIIYAFIDYESYLYFVSKQNHQELKYAVVTGVFESPGDVDDPLTEYPLSEPLWEEIAPGIINTLAARPYDDPLNNSEPDYPANDKRRKESSEKEV